MVIYIKLKSLILTPIYCLILISIDSLIVHLLNILIDIDL